MIHLSTDTPTFESIFVDGRVGVGATESLMTMVFDRSRAAERNPPTGSDWDVGKMPFNHAALRVTPNLLSKLTNRWGPESVEISLKPYEIVWKFDNDDTVTITDLIDEMNDEIDGEQIKYGYHYPDHKALIRKVIEELGDLQNVGDVYGAAFSVALGAKTTQLLVRIARILGLPSNKIEGNWREGEAASFLITGGTPNYHIVRYFGPDGYFRNDIFTLVGSRENIVLEPSSSVLPEFALRDGRDRPTYLWEDEEQEPKPRSDGRASGEIMSEDDTYTDDEIIDGDGRD